MMKRFLLAFLILSSVVQTTPVVFANELAPTPERLITDFQMTDTHAMTKDQLNEFLTRGSLSTYQTKDVTGEIKSAADIIIDTALRFQLNPQLLLALLQREQSLVEDPTPSQNQLDWAMGYAVCDSCSKSDSSIQKYRGFGNQVYYAAARIRNSYLSDLENHGKTSSGIGPGIPSIIDGVQIIPSNLATASLYTYTPHLHGNLNLIKIWNRWFTQNFPNGSLLQDKDTGSVWLIQSDTKRPITSKAAFHSRFNSANIISVASKTLDRYTEGRSISFPNYSLLRSPKGTVFLIVNDTRRGFTSKEAMRASGFSTDEIVDVSFEDLAAYRETDPITAKTVYAQGTLLQDKKSGGIFYVQDGKKHPVMSREILTARFPHPSIVSVSPKDLAAYETKDPLTFPDGTLIGVKGSPDIFVIENGLRRPIADEVTFFTFGWNWKQIAWTNERSVLIQALGEPLSTAIPKEDAILQSVSIK